MDREGRNYQGRNPWQLAKQTWLCSDPQRGLKGEPLSSGFSTDGSSISVSAVCHCEVGREYLKKEKKKKTRERFVKNAGEWTGKVEISKE